jgi:hypothetical protein
MMGGLNVYVGIPLFPPTSARFPTIGPPSCLRFCCFSIAIPTFLRVPVSLGSSVISFHAPFVVFCLPSVVAVIPEVAWLPTALARGSSRVSSPA